MILSLASLLLRKWKEYNTYYDTKYQLNRLSNRDLRDLGIARCDIEFIAREHSKNADAILASK